MIERRFYQLTKTPLEKAVSGLSQIILKSNQSTLIVTKSNEQLQALDEALWEHAEFLPHSCSVSDGISKILISTEVNSNADVGLIMDDLEPDISSFKLVCYMFHSVNTDHVNTRRKNWKSWLDEGAHLTYWAENEVGKWEKKSEANAPKNE